ncbi:hypothetical protein [Fibrobacter sp. UBA4297]|uniref:hypothetical protein n=1 Tax=Fibrobacter sp. UBA4297 TaxID=1946536 RepID=UPI0025BDD26F|nr:hypothetical protein [Fibrobacter sp. UBA4297]
MFKFGVFAGFAAFLSMSVLGCSEDSPTQSKDNYSEQAENHLSSSKEESPDSVDSQSSDSKELLEVEAVTTSSSSSRMSQDKIESSSSRTSQNNVVSSSSRNASSSSSSRAASSSSSSVDDKSYSLYGGASYKRVNVVASNADELECDDKTKIEDLKGFDVAYEFNSPYDLGRDYLGDNNAYQDDKVSAISAECGSIVFDGSNGLHIPLSETFESSSFVVEVRFMPTKAGNMANIFVAEPPGREKDGWQLRLDGSDIYFHIRDVEIRDTWEEMKVGAVSMDEWHVVRVRFFPTMSAVTKKTVYSLNVALDGKTRIATEIKSKMDIGYGLGIGYDSMYQDLHADRFFTGKIDYIRYGRIAEGK